MADPNAGPDLEPRIPEPEDLVRLCHDLNATGAKYVVVGGMAIIQHGFSRMTGDIDLIVDTSDENFARVKEAMMKLPDGAIREIQPGELDQFVVIRVADEILVDLMKSACGIDYATAEKEIEWHMVQGVRIPFASPRLLWKLKQTHREKDALDRVFLAELLKKRGESPPL
jgi:hypothetical protein